MTAFGWGRSPARAVPCRSSAGVPAAVAVSAKTPTTSGETRMPGSPRYRLEPGTGRETQLLKTRRDVARERAVGVGARSGLFEMAAALGLCGRVALGNNRGRELHRGSPWSGARAPSGRADSRRSVRWREPCSPVLEARSGARWRLPDSSTHRRLPDAASPFVRRSECLAKQRQRVVDKV